MKKFLALALGCIVSQTSVFAYGPLISAVIEGYPPFVEGELRSPGADVNERGYKDDTALHYAVGYDGAEALEIVGLLLNAGANVNLQNTGGQTPLEYAESQGKQQAAKLIRDHIAALERARLESIRRAIVALRLSQHPRAGENSTAKSLTVYDCMLIFEFLKQG